MTRKQHRQWKKKNLENIKSQPNIDNERPAWADDDKQEIEDRSWLENLKKEVKEAIKLRDAA